MPISAISSLGNKFDPRNTCMPGGKLLFRPELEIIIYCVTAFQHHSFIHLPKEKKLSFLQPIELLVTKNHARSASGWPDPENL